MQISKRIILISNTIYTLNRTFLRFVRSILNMSIVHATMKSKLTMTERRILYVEDKSNPRLSYAIISKYGKTNPRENVKLPSPQPLRKEVEHNSPNSINNLIRFIVKRWFCTTSYKQHYRFVYTKLIRISHPYPSVPPSWMVWPFVYYFYYHK